MRQKLIKDIKNPLGYFFIIATARSGHNYIKNNILSWSNDIAKEKRYYVNLENFLPEKFNSCIYDAEVDLSLYPNSIKIIMSRSLLNWYISFLYLTKPFNNKEKIIRNNLTNIENNIIIHKSEFDNLRRTYPDIENNPTYIIIPDELTKEDFISRKNKTLNASISLDSVLNTWLCIAKEFTGETSYLDGFVKIYYDDFFISEEYRKNICSQLNEQYNDNVLNVVTPEGRYSSFDRDAFQNNAQSMNVLERWKHWKNEDKKYLQNLKNHEALNFYLNNFQVSDDERNFINSI